MIKQTLGFMVAALLLVVASTVLVMGGLEWHSRKACDSYSQATGYWVTYIKWDGCYVLLDNQYLVKKDKLLPTDEPARDPAIVGIDAVLEDL